MQGVGAESDHEFMVNFETDQADLEEFSQKVSENFVKKFGKDSFEIRRAEIVGPKVGKDLREKALLAVGLSCLACSSIYGSGLSCGSVWGQSLP